MATSRKNIRTEIGELEHITLMLTTNAAGSVVLPYFLFPAEVLSSAPLSTVDDEEVISSAKNNAYMDQQLFQEWLIHFINFVKKRDPNGPHLLILDGHNSRIDVDTLVTAAVHGIFILCLPSHLTHLLQPNDANFNWKFKDLLGKSICTLITTGKRLTYPLLSRFIYDVLKKVELEVSVRASFRKTGVFPFDDSRVLKLLESEKPTNPLSKRAQGVFAVIQDCMEEREIATKFLSEVEKRALSTTSRKRFFSSKSAQILTNA